MPPRQPKPTDILLYEFSGPNDTVPSMAVDGPPPSTPRYPRHLGWRQPSVSGSGCLASSVATLIGLRAPLVAAVMGEHPDIGAASRAVELWSGEHTLSWFEHPLEWAPQAGKLIVVYRAPAPTGKRRARDESGRFLAEPVHAAVVHGDDASLYYDPHDESWSDPEPLGYLQVVSAIPTPSYLERTS